MTALRRYRRILWVSVYAFFSGVVLLATYLIARYFPYTDGQSVEVEVPDLVGSIYAEQDGRLPNELYEVVFDYRADASTAPGTVLAQEPPPLSRRRAVAGRSPCTVHLTLSTGAAQFTLPPLIGTGAREAEVLLRSHGLTVRVRQVTRNDLSAGQVIGVEPPEGTVVREGEVVTLSESRVTTIKTVRVPDVRGLTAAQANQALVLRGLRPSEPIYQAAAQPSGTVISQRPLAGTLVPSGTRATLTVSEGGADAAEQELQMEMEE